MRPPVRLFVYGTLRKDSRSSKHRMLAQGTRFVGHARTRGRLYDLGSYPGLVLPGAPDAWVRGEVYALERAPEILARLDEYEGCGPNRAKPHQYERVQGTVVMDTGEEGLAWVYVFKGSVAGKNEILSGDYCGLAAAPEADREQNSGSRRER